MPPVGHREKIQTLLDPDLLNYEWLWAAAGTPHVVFQLTPQELQEMTEGRFIDLRVDDGKN